MGRICRSGKRRQIDAVGAMREARGLLMGQGRMVEATIIAAPPATKNKQNSRDPERHQTRKGNQWHFGMTAPIGVDVASGLVHTVVGTAANKADVTQTAALLHGHAEAVFGDAGDPGADKRPERADREVSWNLAIRRSILKDLPKALRELAEPVERALSQVRAVVEHPCHILKNRCRHKKLRYRGVEKNTAQLYTLFALADLVIVKPGSPRQIGRMRPAVYRGSGTQEKAQTGSSEVHCERVIDPVRDRRNDAPGS